MSSKDPWTPKGVAISLSASRRAALKAFADSSGSAPPLTPAQALYSLIDLINPAGEAAAEEDARDAGNEPPDESSERWAHPPLVSAPSPAIDSSELRERLNAIESRFEGLVEAMQACAQAVESVAASLIPAEDANVDQRRIGDGAGAPEKPGQDDEPTAPAALPPRDWIRAVMREGEADGPVEKTITLTLAGRTPQPGGATMFIFACAPWPAPNGAEFVVALPDLLATERESGALALLTAIEPNARLVASVQIELHRWALRIGRLGARGVVGAPLYRCAG